jgi:signal transduction histidine kinase
MIPYLKGFASPAKKEIFSRTSLLRELDFPASPVSAAFDREGLTQVIRNLIDNASPFNPALSSSI